MSLAMTNRDCFIQIMQIPGLPGKKGEQVKHPTLIWNSSYITTTVLFSNGFSLFCCRSTGGAGPAWFRGTKRTKRGTRTERRESEEPLDDNVPKYVTVCMTYMVCVYANDVCCSVSKGSPGSGGSGVAGPKGEPGEKVSCHRSHQEYKVHSHNIYNCCDTSLAIEYIIHETVPCVICRCKSCPRTSQTKNK